MFARQLYPLSQFFATRFSRTQARVGFVVLVGVVLGNACLQAADSPALRVDPPVTTLTGAESQQQLLVTWTAADRETDVTDRTQFASSNPQVALVSDSGIVTPVADGTTTITASWETQTASIQVTVVQATFVSPLHFANDIVPLLSKAGCNAGSCHGKQGGQNGFQLSVFGFDAAADYDALVRQAKGRRLFPAAPERSLLLTKAANLTPHGGGRKLTQESAEYQRLLRWIRSGMPVGQADAPQVTGLSVFPTQRVMSEMQPQRLLVTAHLSDGTSRDVTHEALYSSNDETLALVDMQGRIQTTMLAGEAAIVARYRDQVASCRITVPINKEADVAAGLAAWDQTHFIDRLAADKWRQLHLLPSPPAADAVFHRRACLDLIGRLPTPEEASAFLADSDPNKRIALVDRLLARPEYADYWALKWADLLKVNAADLGAKAAFQYHQGLHEALVRNQPYDEFLHDLMTAQGSTQQNWAVHFYKAFAKPEEASIAVSQVFLGVRLECAKCHHHPYENWGQEDFFGLAAFFARMQQKKGDGSEQIYYVGDKGEVKHPRTSEVVLPQVLLGEPLEIDLQQDPRQELADWMTQPDNPFVARAIVNRVWSQLMGRGLVEPIDDMRDTNPATNEPLLAALVEDFVQHDYDMKHLLRTIAVSRLYGLSSLPNAMNARDTQNYSRAYRKRLGAEVLLDAVGDVTGSHEELAGMPAGARAVQAWNHELPSRFLDTFGRPARKTVCQCERVNETTLSQVLHLMNGPLVSDKITDPAGRAAALAASDRTPAEIIAALYLAAYGRPPTDAEQAAAATAFTAPDATRRSAAEDILWSLINSAEFVLNH
ncbi:DUF1553 domain-containing protein [Lignipirellula cremea]|uniref:Bacterial Ig-like domain (Group 2) n=1 Tax=Lignipirellula cremea TaxID=2528010 RepID=A0A518DS68_9BACT|nr:DUF1553 domain-containing protein [Lignipirellula cremea]QDU94679.1 Bacterial Ig-like domain (group 2) [Lignipirellula cremea]